MQQVEQDWGLTVVSVVSLHDIIAWVETHPDMAQHREALEQYREALRCGVNISPPRFCSAPAPLP